MQFLKADTAITLRMGPFLDETTGKDAEEALTIAQADIRLSKAGGDFAQVNDNQGGGNAPHDENGWYELDLNTTDTNTEGMLTVAVHESGALPVWMEFMVVNDNTYEAFFENGAEILTVDVTQINTIATQLQMLMDASTTINADADLTGVVVDKSVLSHIMTPAADTSTYNASEDSLEASGTDNDALITGVAACNTTTPPTVAEIQTEMEENGDSILDTIRDLLPGTTIAAATDVSGAHTTTDAKIDTTDGLIGGLNDVSVANLNTACDTVTVTSIGNDVITAASINTGAIAKDAVGSTALDNVVMSDLASVPTATATIVAAINWIYELSRNALTTEGTNNELELTKNDGSTVFAEADISDDGTDFVRGAWGTPD